jgi:hypothetical protein
MIFVRPGGRANVANPLAIAANYGRAPGEDPIPVTSGGVSAPARGRAGDATSVRWRQYP